MSSQHKTTHIGLHGRHGASKAFRSKLCLSDWWALSGFRDLHWIMTRCQERRVSTFSTHAWAQSDCAAASSLQKLNGGCCYVSRAHCARYFLGISLSSCNPESRCLARRRYHQRKPACLQAHAPIAKPVMLPSHCVHSNGEVTAVRLDRDNRPPGMGAACLRVHPRDVVKSVCGSGWQRGRGDTRGIPPVLPSRAVV